MNYADEFARISAEGDAKFAQIAAESDKQLQVLIQQLSKLFIFWLLGIGISGLLGFGVVYLFSLVASL